MSKATDKSIFRKPSTVDDRAITVGGARVNNLKNVSLTIPRGKLVVVTGVSGSGKSSLAFDTLYAEGQRRYVESLSAYARQFMGKMVKPDADYIRGLPPAIAIEQKVNTRNPRSTVGTSAEIYDYLRLLFGRIGRTYSPVIGELVKRHTVADVVACAAGYPEGTRVAVVAPVRLPDKRRLVTQLGIYLKEGFTRIVRDGRFVSIEELVASGDIDDTTDATGIDLLIDRLATAADGDEASRLADSLETAFFEGHGEASLLVWPDGASAPVRHDFNERFEADGITFAEPTDQMFNFNNPFGACPTCEGLGVVRGYDERLVIPDPTLSVYEGAVRCWQGEKMGEWRKRLIEMAVQLNFPIHKPYNALTPEQKKLLWRGNGADWQGIDGFFRMIEEKRGEIRYRVLAARYQGRTVCPKCEGTRLRPDALYVKVGGKTISELSNMPVAELRRWFDDLDATLLRESPGDHKIAARVLTELHNRLRYLDEVGLGYLTLNRPSATLSGGESQRINLSTSLGNSLVGSLYILDEPSIGLHSRDTLKLIGVLRRLQEAGNTVLVVEHDEEIIEHADLLIDVGPDAGRFGGEIVYSGPIVPSTPDMRGYTLKYLDGSLSIPVPKHRRKWRDSIMVRRASHNNLKGIDVKFPLGVMTVVTGVSGSGKSTLVRDVLYRALARHFDMPGDAPGAHSALEGDLKRIEAVEFVDQNPIGKSTRSNPATYLKAYDEIRKLYADQQGAVQMGYGPGYFSFNTEGGRCEECKGEGTITIEMQFMADITIPCEACHGKRFKKAVLDVRYRDKNISDVLDMSVKEAISFFGEAAADGDSQAAKVVRRLQPLADVGLGYIKLGQSSATLSGGENQRVKLAYFLSMEKSRPTLFIFDEPTTGLHFHDINTLMDSFNRLIANGHTVLIIEHNMDVIKCADHIIDIGPEGGDGGGTVVAQGTPEQVSEVPESHTGRFLRPKLGLPPLA